MLPPRAQGGAAGSIVPDPGFTAKRVAQKRCSRAGRADVPAVLWSAAGAQQELMGQK